MNTYLVKLSEKSESKHSGHRKLSIVNLDRFLLCPNDNLQHRWWNLSVQARCVQFSLTLRDFLALKVKTAISRGKDGAECVVHLRVTALYKWEHECKCHRMHSWERNVSVQQVSTPVLTESEPCWRALGLKLKRELTWHILVSNCCVLSLINNGTEFELQQIRAVNLLSVSLSLNVSCTASAFVDPLCLWDDLFHHYITSFAFFIVEHIALKVFLWNGQRDSY